MSEKFNPKQYITTLRGKEYLEVKWRLVWFRHEHPNGSIKTEVVNQDPLMLKATVMDGTGVILSTGHGSAEKKQGAVWNGRELEKAETAAVGRALAHAGYGTQFTGEEEGDNIVDAPVEKKTIRELYAERLLEAHKLGIDVTAYNINEKMTDDEIIALGKDLKEQIKKAGK